MKYPVKWIGIRYYSSYLEVTRSLDTGGTGNIPNHDRSKIGGGLTRYLDSPTSELPLVDEPASLSLEAKSTLPSIPVQLDDLVRKSREIQCILFDRMATLPHTVAALWAFSPGKKGRIM